MTETRRARGQEGEPQSLRQDACSSEPISLVLWRRAIGGASSIRGSLALADWKSIRQTGWYRPRKRPLGRRGPTRRNPPAALTERRLGADESATLSQMRGSSADYWWPCPAAVLSVRPGAASSGLTIRPAPTRSSRPSGNQHVNACMNGSGLMTAFNLLGIAVTCPLPRPKGTIAPAKQHHDSLPANICFTFRFVN